MNSVSLKKALQPRQPLDRTANLDFERPPQGGLSLACVARIEPPDPAFGRPDDKLSEIRDRPVNTATPRAGFR